MKKSELKEFFEDECFDVVFQNDNTFVYFPNTDLKIAKISEKEECSLNIYLLHWDNFNNKKDILNTIVEYASTPIKDRVDEVKYKLYHRYMNNPKDSQYYKVSLTLDENDCLAVVKNEEFLPSHQVIKKEFTEEEIEQIKEMYRTTLDDFEIYEVGEEDELD